MKVSEAKTKVCPFQGNMVDAFCICGDCMAWVYTMTEDTSNATVYRDVNTRKDVIHGARKLSEDEKEGYCKRLEQ